VGVENPLANQVVEVAYDILAWAWVFALLVVQAASQYCAVAALVIFDYLDSTA